MREIYIIDKEDLPKLIKGESITLENGGAFSIEINGAMTNGDVIKALFPNCYLKCDFATILLVECGGGYISCPVDWWNSPYKEEQE